MTQHMTPFCHGCGRPIRPGEPRCPSCGAGQAVPFQTAAAQGDPRRGAAIVLAWVATAVAIVALVIAGLALGRSASANRAAESAMSDASAASNEAQSLRDDIDRESDPLANHPGSDTPASTSDTTSDTTSAPSDASGCVRARSGQVTVRTTTFDFDPQCITVDSAELTVVYDNQEKGVKHNITFKGANDAAGRPASTPLVTGPSTQTVTLANLTPGTYTFICDIHANMRGTLIVDDA